MNVVAEVRVRCNLFCPTCGTLISADDIDIDRAPATCRACNSVTSVDQFGSQVVGTRAPPSPMRRNRQEIPRPSHFSVKDDGSSLRIRFRWIWRRFRGAATMFLAWNSFLVFYYWLALRTGGRPMWLAVIWGIPFVAIGLLLSILASASRHSPRPARSGLSR
jgi:hypothetical protein